MVTEAKVSLSGENKKPMRKAVADLLLAAGFRRLSITEFISRDGMSPEKALAIANEIYRLEKKCFPVEVMTLLIRSPLSTVEFRRNKYRYI